MLDGRSLLEYFAPLDRVDITFLRWGGWHAWWWGLADVINAVPTPVLLSPHHAKT
jgi:hypothetical protein